MRTFVILVLTSICQSYAPTSAAMMDFRSSPQSQLDFSLLIHQNRVSLKDSENTLDTDVLGFGFQVIDIPPDLPIQIGFGVGYAFIDQQIVPGLNNANMGGLYFTLLARATVFATPSWSSETIFAYDYLTTEKNSESQNSRLRWNHFTAEANLNYWVTPYLSLKFGALYGRLDAKLSGSGDNNISLTLDTDEHVAAFAGINYHVADQQKVAITLQQGYFKRLIVQFQRTFY
ncbi:MAG: hypothetical protein PVF82_00730 [Gammaproteobacteria bacterium]